MKDNPDSRNVREALTNIIAALEQHEQFLRRSCGRSRDCPGREALVAAADDVAACREKLEARLEAVMKRAVS